MTEPRPAPNDPILTSPDDAAYPYTRAATRRARRRAARRTRRSHRLEFVLASAAAAAMGLSAWLHLQGDPQTWVLAVFAIAGFANLWNAVRALRAARRRDG
jgi:hypothetical protein